MGPEILREVIHRWNKSDASSRNCLMKQFLENNGDFHSQGDWLRFLASAFNMNSFRHKKPRCLDLNH